MTILAEFPLQYSRHSQQSCWYFFTSHFSLIHHKHAIYRKLHLLLTTVKTVAALRILTYTNILSLETTMIYKLVKFIYSYQRCYLKKSRTKNSYSFFLFESAKVKSYKVLGLFLPKKLNMFFCFLTNQGESKKFFLTYFGLKWCRSYLTYQGGKEKTFLSYFGLKCCRNYLLAQNK